MRRRRVCTNVPTEEGQNVIGYLHRRANFTGLPNTGSFVDNGGLLGNTPKGR